MERILGSLAIFLVVGCSGANQGGSDSPAEEVVLGDETLDDGTGEPGFITFMAEGRVLRVSAGDGTLEELNESLDALGAGSDAYPAASKNGEYLTLQSERFASECSGWRCVAILDREISEFETVRVNGQPLRPEGRTAISDDGSVLVYAGRGGKNDHDLYALRRQGSGWGTPTLLTGASSFAYNDQPVFSYDGARIAFDCGPVPYGQAGTGICVVNVDGTGFQRLVDPAEGPGGSSENQARHADFTVAGGLIFEADWNSEQIWYLSSEGAAASAFAPDYSNDNSPCVLPNNAVASLWLGRPDTAGLHELKISSADATEHGVLLPDLDVADIGMSCHK